MVQLLTLFLLGLGGGVTASSGSGSTSGCGSGADVGDEFADILSLEGLGVKAGPVALNGVSAGLDDLGEFLILRDTRVK